MFQPGGAPGIEPSPACNSRHWLQGLVQGLGAARGRQVTHSCGHKGVTTPPASLQPPWGTGLPSMCTGLSTHHAHTPEPCMPGPGRGCKLRAAT